MELSHLINLISELPEDIELKYVRGDDTCIFKRVDTDEPRVFAMTNTGKMLSWAPSYLRELADKIRANVLFNISALLNNKGSFRTVIETIIAHTSEFYWVRCSNQIMVVWRPDVKHAVGELTECDVTDVLDSSSDDTLIVNETTELNYSTNQLVELLKSMYAKQNVAGIHMFGIKYGQYLEDMSAQDLVTKAGLPSSYFVELNKGKALYRALMSNDFGVRFYKPREIVAGEKKRSATTAPLQQIFYGAPGTGKSHAIKRETKGQKTIRTTFHPDTDYASFVGAYKPTMKRVDVQVVPVVLNNGASFEQNRGTFSEERISYEFVMQSFLQAYVAAWERQKEENPEPIYLIIEEINRGNCAQIFGDIFQLLDRNDNGFSEYPISADKDMRSHLAKVLSDIEVANESYINSLFEGEDNIVDEIKSGKVLVLPDNLYIWATMNTSDQSLFPIDSAFKRRWEWKYVPISDAREGWTLSIGGKRYDWWKFLTEINRNIDDITKSEDKKLGYFFCKAVDGTISAETFVSKVVFYLWNDVFKDYGLDGPLFKDADGTDLSFNKFYRIDGEGRVAVDTGKVALFLNNLGVLPVSGETEERVARVD